MKPMPRSAMQVSPQRAAIRAEQGSQGLKKFDQANYQNRQATMQQAQQGMGQPFLDPNQLTRQGIRRFEGNAALKQYDQEMYKEKQNPNYATYTAHQYTGTQAQQAGMNQAAQQAAQQMSYGQGMPANFVGGLGSGIAAGLGSGIVANRGGQTNSRQLSPAEQARARAEAIMRGDTVTMDYNQERDTLVEQYLQEMRGAGPGGASKNPDNGQAYAGGNPNFDERSGQFNNLIRYNNPRSAQGPDRMGMPQAYPDRIADPMRPQGDRGPLTRVSPGVYRNTQGQLTGPGGRVMPNQPNRNPAQGNATDMWNNMQPQNPQGNISNKFYDMVLQPGNPKGPQGTLPYGGQQPQNPIYRTPGYSYNLPQNTNVMPGWAGPRPSFSPGQYLNRGR